MLPCVLFCPHVRKRFYVKTGLTVIVLHYYFQILAKRSGVDCSQVRTFFDVQNKLGKSFDEMLHLVDKEFRQAPYTKEEVCKILEISEKELAETLLSKNTQDG